MAKEMDVNKAAIKLAYETIRSQVPWCHSPEMLHHRVTPYATLSPWLNDHEFLEVYHRIKNNTLVDIYRCFELWTLAKQSVKVKGNILEVGVWRGGTGAILAEATKTCKIVYLADTFTGVVKAGPKDTKYTGGEHSDTSAVLVADLMRELQIQNFVLLQGVFPEETAHLVDDEISLLHCDVDVYASCYDVVEWCLPKMPIGGVLVFDDYGFFGCEGVTAFCKELTKRFNLLFLHNLNGHGVFIKIKN